MRTSTGSCCVLLFRVERVSLGPKTELAPKARSVKRLKKRVERGDILKCEVSRKSWVPPALGTRCTKKSGQSPFTCDAAIPHQSLLKATKSDQLVPVASAVSCLCFLILTYVPLPQQACWRGSRSRERL